MIISANKPERTPKNDPRSNLFFITAAVLIYVFYLPGTLQMGPEKTRLAYLRERRDVVYENLRDLNFEFKSGKFPDSDYQSMKTSLEDEAAAILAEMAPP